MTVQVVIFVVVIIGVWLFLTYNGLVRLRQYCRESWATIDTELKRRHDLVPALVATVKGYAGHEQSLFAEVADARARAVEASGSAAQKAAHERPLVEGTQRLLAVAEQYPELKASEHFLALQRELVDTEDRIQASRRLYNANVRELNTRLQVFPANLVGRWFHFAPAEYFEVESAVVRRVVEVSFNDGSPA